MSDLLDALKILVPPDAVTALGWPAAVVITVLGVASIVWLVVLAAVTKGS